jgi:exodeoxyribonuclease-1
MKTMYWHDYETWGEIPSQDRPSQFAGLRTDEDLNIIGAPLVLYCQPSSDIVPKPEACLVTGITPQKALSDGVPEPEFIAAIHAELSAPETCGVGYNTLRFDDEVTRYSLYRNFYDPYEREWKAGNSRWDIIDMVRLTRTVRPEGIEWPDHEDGRPSFKLEHLTKANGLAHEDAHDALSDVYATIAVAKLIKQKQPKLYEYVYQLRDKNRLKALVDLNNKKPLLHISSMFPSENGCAAIVMPIAMHPVNKNGVIVFDLSSDPAPLMALSADQIASRVFTKREDLEEGVDRISLKVVHLNKCPILTTVKLMEPATANKWGIDMSRCERHWHMLKQANISSKVQSVFGLHKYPPAQDPEQQLYDGFISQSDKQLSAKVRKMSPEQLMKTEIFFSDSRLNTLLWRYKARFYPATLTESEKIEWQSWRHKKLTDPSLQSGITIEESKARIRDLRKGAELNNTIELNDAQKYVLIELEKYLDTLL